MALPPSRLEASAAAASAAAAFTAAAAGAGALLFDRGAGGGGVGVPVLLLGEIDPAVGQVGVGLLLPADRLHAPHLEEADDGGNDAG